MNKAILVALLLSQVYAYNLKQINRSEEPSDKEHPSRNSSLTDLDGKRFDKNRPVRERKQKIKKHKEKEPKDESECQSFRKSYHFEFEICCKGKSPEECENENPQDSCETSNDCAKNQDHTKCCIGKCVDEEEVCPCSVSPFDPISNYQCPEGEECCSLDSTCKPKEDCDLCPVILCSTDAPYCCNSECQKYPCDAECQDNYDCNEGQQCCEGVCKNGDCEQCESNYDCPKGEECCRVDNRCKKPEDCDLCPLIKCGRDYPYCCNSQCQNRPCGLECMVNDDCQYGNKCCNSVCIDEEEECFCGTFTPGQPPSNCPDGEECCPGNLKCEKPNECDLCPIILCAPESPYCCDNACQNRPCGLECAVNSDCQYGSKCCNSACIDEDEYCPCGPAYYGEDPETCPDGEECCAGNNQCSIPSECDLCPIILCAPETPYCCDNQCQNRECGLECAVNEDCYYGQKCCNSVCVENDEACPCGDIYTGNPLNCPNGEECCAGNNLCQVPEECDLCPVIDCPYDLPFCCDNACQNRKCGQECAVNDDCQYGYKCCNSECIDDQYECPCGYVEPGEYPLNCPDGEECCAGNNLCQPPKECDLCPIIDCPYDLPYCCNNACQNRKCGQECAVNTDCYYGQKCCNSECIDDDQECPCGYVQPGEYPMSCPDGEECCAGNNLCQPPKDCDLCPVIDCPYDLPYCCNNACQNRQCGQECAVNDDCQYGYKCCNSYCVDEYAECPCGYTQPGDYPMSCPDDEECCAGNNLCQPPEDCDLCPIIDCPYNLPFCCDNACQNRQCGQECAVNDDCQYGYKCCNSYCVDEEENCPCGYTQPGDYPMSCPDGEECCAGNNLCQPPEECDLCPIIDCPYALPFCCENACQNRPCGQECAVNDDCQYGSKCCNSYCIDEYEECPCGYTQPGEYPMSCPDGEECCAGNNLCQEPEECDLCPIIDCPYNLPYCCDNECQNRQCGQECAVNDDCQYGSKCCNSYCIDEDEECPCGYVQPGEYPMSCPDDEECCAGNNLCQPPAECDLCPIIDCEYATPYCCNNACQNRPCNQECAVNGDCQYGEKCCNSFCVDDNEDCPCGYTPNPYDFPVSCPDGEECCAGNNLCQPEEECDLCPIINCSYDTPYCCDNACQNRPCGQECAVNNDCQYGEKCCNSYCIDEYEECPCGYVQPGEYPMSCPDGEECCAGNNLCQPHDDCDLCPVIKCSYETPYCCDNACQNRPCGQECAVNGDCQYGEKCCNSYCVEEDEDCPCGFQPGPGEYPVSCPDNEECCAGNNLCQPHDDCDLCPIIKCSYDKPFCCDNACQNRPCGQECAVNNDCKYGEKCCNSYCVDDDDECPCKPGSPVYGTDPSICPDREECCATDQICKNPDDCDLCPLITCPKNEPYCCENACHAIPCDAECTSSKQCGYGESCCDYQCQDGPCKCSSDDQCEGGADCCRGECLPVGEKCKCNPYLNSNQCGQNEICCDTTFTCTKAYECPKDKCSTIKCGSNTPFCCVDHCQERPCQCEENYECKNKGGYCCNGECSDIPCDLRCKKDSDCKQNGGPTVCLKGKCSSIEEQSCSSYKDCLFSFKTPFNCCAGFCSQYQCKCKKQSDCDKATFPTDMCCATTGLCQSANTCPKPKY